MMILAAPASKPAPRVDQAALDALVKRAGELDTDGLVVMKDGEVILEKWFDGAPRKIEAMSVTKSVTALAIGRLLTTKALKSVDEPVATWFPEWNQGRKRLITVRHLLEMSSGLQAESSSNEVYPAPDFVQLALCAELANDPGARFFYNNKASNLLAGIVERISGKKLDDFLRSEVFTPLGITDVGWLPDRAGNPQGMSGLQIKPTDLAKLGQLMLDEGRWQGREILDADWVKAATAPSKAMNRYGQLWWLLPDVKITIDDVVLDAWTKGGADPRFIDAMRPLKGRILGDDLREVVDAALADQGGAVAWDKNTWQKGLPDGSLVSFDIAGYRADGWQGQQVVVWKKERIVVVRMRDPKDNTDEENKRFGFGELAKMARALEPTTSTPKTSTPKASAP